MICSKDDPNYGKPDKNSASAMRAAAGEAKMRGDICDVCEVIFNSGQRSEDGCAAIQFGELFEVNILSQKQILDIYRYRYLQMKICSLRSTIGLTIKLSGY